MPIPAINVYLYAESDGRCPVLEWLRELLRTNERAALACLARVRLLQEHGHALRRPHADFLRDGIYELRAKVGRVNYRLLYFSTARK